MNKYLIEWLEALRSGKYKQGRRFLRNNGEFCCLGVLCDINMLGTSCWRPDASRDMSKLVFGGKELYSLPPKQFIDLLDLPPEMITEAQLDDGFSIRVQRRGCEWERVDVLNDNGSSFGLIAELVEKTYLSLKGQPDGN